MKTTQAIQLIKLPADAKCFDSKHRFLQETLLAEVKFYQDSDQREYVSFFDQVFFVLHEVDEQSAKQLPKALWGMKAEPACIYYIHHASQNDESDSISKLLRNSKTLELCDKNTFDSTSLKAVFSERGAWIWPKKNGRITFERYRLLYLLARSYNLFAEMELKQVVKVYDAKDLGQMIHHRETVLAFDLKCFYANPVLVDRYELYQAWPLLTGLFNVNQVHDEMKSQIQDLSELISAKQQTQLDSRYKRIEVLFWIFGGLVAFITLMDSETVGMAWDWLSQIKQQPD